MAESVEARIRELMDRCASLNEAHLRIRLRLVFLPFRPIGGGDFAKGGEQVKVAFPTAADRKGDSLAGIEYERTASGLILPVRPDHKGTAPEGVVVFPDEALQGCSEHDFWGAARVEYDAAPESRHGVLLFLLWGGAGDNSAVESFSQLAAESGRLYQTLPVPLAPIHSTSSPRNLWATVMYAWLRGTDWVAEGNGFRCIALPFAASGELWRRLLYGTAPDGRIDSSAASGTACRVKAGEAFLRALESDPNAKAAWDQTRERLQAFAAAMQAAMASPENSAAEAERRRQSDALGEAIRAALRAAGDERAARHFTPPQSIEDWEHLARIVQIPLPRILGRNLTLREIHAVALAWADRQTIKVKLATDTDAVAGQGEPAEAAGEPAATKTKRSTERGEGRVKLIAALTKHHRYADGSCLNLEPIGNNELAKAAGVSTSTASTFFNNEFEGHAKYRVVCRDAGRLADSLKALNDEFSPHDLYGRRPAGEDDRDSKGDE